MIFIDFVKTTQKGEFILDVLNNILALLKTKGIRQKDLSDYLGLSKNTMTGWKNGNNTSYMKHLPKIADFLGVSIDSLLGKDDSLSENSFTYALYDELAHDLSEEQLKQLKQFADFLRNGN